MNIANLLKYCPKGTKLYSTIFGTVEFEKIVNPNIIKVILPCTFETKKENFFEDGHYSRYGECALFPSKEQRDWSKFTAPWLKKEKFDPKTLKPFDRILVIDYPSQHWCVGLFSYYIKSDIYPCKCVGSHYKYCIPYNDDTKHLVGTADEAPEYYRYWEE